MTWLFPLYLLGAGAILAPILMHLRRRPPQDRVPFSSLMFLSAQTPQPVRRRRLENWLLLLLRCLVLIALALMFARPLLRGDNLGDATRSTAAIILLDRSASMRRADLWQKAVAEASALVRDAQPEDRIALAIFDHELEMLWTFAEDRQSAGGRVAAVQQRLASHSPGWGGTDLGGALGSALNALTGSPEAQGRKKRIIAFSDFQEGAKVDSLRELVWPENVGVELRQLSAPDENNFSVTLAATSAEDTPSAPGALQAAQTRVRIGSARNSRRNDFSLSWTAPGSASVTGHLPPGSTRVIAAPPAPASDQPQVLTISGDDHDFDNRVFVAPPQPKTALLAFIGQEKSRAEASAPLYYLSRALQDTPSIKTELIVRPNPRDVPAQTHLVFAPNVPPPGEPTAVMRRYVESGGILVQVVDTAAAEPALRELTGTADLRVEDPGASRQEYLMLGNLDATHRLLRPFADPRLRDFTKLRFWHHRRLVIGPNNAAALRAIAEFDNGDPAMVTASIGKGTLVLLASGWHPADSQLALSTKFIPLVYGWLEAAGFRHEPPASLLVGDIIPAPSGATIQTPGGQSHKAKAGAPDHTAREIGFYTVAEASTAKPLVYAVNLAPEESRISPMPPERLRELGASFTISDSAAAPQPASSGAERERLAISEQEGRQRAWLWLLAALVTLLAAETALASRDKSRGEVLASGT